MPVHARAQWTNCERRSAVTTAEEEEVAEAPEPWYSGLIHTLEPRYQRLRHTPCLPRPPRSSRLTPICLCPPPPPHAQSRFSTRRSTAAFYRVLPPPRFPGLIVLVHDPPVFLGRVFRAQHDGARASADRKSNSRASTRVVATCGRAFLPQSRAPFVADGIDAREADYESKRTYTTVFGIQRRRHTDVNVRRRSSGLHHDHRRRREKFAPPMIASRARTTPGRLSDNRLATFCPRIRLNALQPRD